MEKDEESKGQGGVVEPITTATNLNKKDHENKLEKSRTRKYEKGEKTCSLSEEQTGSKIRSEQKKGEN